MLRIYSALRITPNQISILGGILGICAAILISQKLFFLAVVCWWMGRLLDGTDGIYARQTNQTSSFGAFLDITTDMAAYSAMIIGFDFAFPELHRTWLVILFLYVLCITGALALGNLEGNLQAKAGVKSDNNRGLRLAAGVAEGGETGIAYTSFLLFPSFIETLSSVWVVILIVTILARFLLARRELSA